MSGAFYLEGVTTGILHLNVKSNFVIASNGFSLLHNVIG